MGNYLATHSKDDDPWEQKNSRTNDVKSPSKLLDEPATQDCQSRNPLAGTLAHADAIGCETVAKAPANPSPNSTFGIVAKAEAEQSCPPSLRPAPNDGRIFVSCPYGGRPDGSLIFLPDTFEDLIRIGVQKYGVLANKIKTLDGNVIEDFSLIKAGDHVVLARDRMIVCCPQKGDYKGRVVGMPKSLEELIHIGVEKYGFVASRITTKEGVRIDNIRDIKDGDIVILE